MTSAKMGAPPSSRSSRLIDVTTTCLSPMSRAASATRRGSSQSRSFCSGRPVRTAQNEHPRVHTFPKIMNVAVPALQHSPMFGHRADEQTVWRSCSSIVFWTSRNVSP